MTRDAIAALAGLIAALAERRAGSLVAVCFSCPPPLERERAESLLKSALGKLGLASAQIQAVSEPGGFRLIVAEFAR